MKWKHNKYWRLVSNLVYMPWEKTGYSPPPLVPSPQNSANTLLSAKVWNLQRSLHLSWFISRCKLASCLIFMNVSLQGFRMVYLQHHNPFNRPINSFMFQDWMTNWSVAAMSFMTAWLVSWCFSFILKPQWDTEQLSQEDKLSVRLVPVFPCILTAWKMLFMQCKCEEIPGILWQSMGLSVLLQQDRVRYFYCNTILLFNFFEFIKDKQP